jgi:hypothetical protein
MTAAYGQIPHRSFIDSISLSKICEIVTTTEHGYATYDFVRLSNLGDSMPPPLHGATQLNGYRYRIIVSGVDRFLIQDPTTYEYIDSTDYTPYTEGGYCNLIEQTFYYYGEDPNG